MTAIDPEGVAFMRGTFYGLALSVPFWLCVFLIIL